MYANELTLNTFRGFQVCESRAEGRTQRSCALHWLRRN